MKTDIAIDKLCNVAPVISSLSESLSHDDEFKSAMQGEKSNRTILFKILPLILKKYRAEVYEILSVWTEKNVEEIKEQPLSLTVNEIKAIWADEDFRSFFSSSNASDSVAGR